MDYSTPKDSCIPQNPIYFQILSNGIIQSTTTPITSKEFITIGRLPTNDFNLLHPSISRNHAIIQYTAPDNTFIYDLNTTHGTFVNKIRIPPQEYFQIYSCDFIRFAESSKQYICQGISERPQEIILQNPTPIIPKTIPIEISNSDEYEHFTSTHDTLNQPTYYKDPKKSLKLFIQHQEIKDYSITFKQDYIDDEDNSMGFIASLKLDVNGNIINAIGQSVNRKTSERNACLDACSQLDKQGLLNNDSNTIIISEKEKRKRLNAIFGDEDGDEDTFYDKTTHTKVEKKQKIETIDTLTVRKHSILQELKTIEETIAKAHSQEIQQQNRNSDEDELDAYMDAMQNKPDPKTILILKSKLPFLKNELAKIEKLIVIATPSFTTNQKLAENHVINSKVEPLALVQKDYGLISAGKFVASSPVVKSHETSVQSISNDDDIEMESSTVQEEQAYNQKDLGGKRIYGALTKNQVDAHYSVETEEYEVAPDITGDAVDDVNAAYGY